MGGFGRSSSAADFGRSVVPHPPHPFKSSDFERPGKGLQSGLMDCARSEGEMTCPVLADAPARKSVRPT